MLMRCLVVSALIFLVTMQSAFPYPIDGYRITRIRRLERLRLLVSAQSGGSRLLPGQLLLTGDIKLHLRDSSEVDLRNLRPDPALQLEVERLFAGRDSSYSLALLDITRGQPVRFAGLRADRSYQPGSVGKLAVAMGLFAELRALFPESVLQRRRLLKHRRVAAGPWIISDHHVVPLFDPDTEEYSSRPIRQGDVFSLYEWVDHMMSPSSNAAASTVWKEAILMRRPVASK
jgi:hypothetical protein